MFDSKPPSYLWDVLKPPTSLVQRFKERSGNRAPIQGPYMMRAGMGGGNRLAPDIVSTCLYVSIFGFHDL